MHLFVECLKAILFGVVEGITEWLPVSSTSHMILLNELVRMEMSEAFMSMFNVVIQLGAILALVVLCFPRLWPFQRPQKGKGVISCLRLPVWKLWLTILVAILPSAVIGLPLDDWMDAHLHTTPVICAMLILYGVLFIVVERRRKPVQPRIQRAEDVDLRTAIIIGFFQVLSLVPGTSRSGATILGGIAVGCSRTAAAEFSFFMAIPTMAGASLLKLIKFGLHFSGAELAVLAVACLTAFLVSLATIRTLFGYIRRHSFEVFGWYRIILGLVVAIVAVAKGI